VAAIALAACVQCGSNPMHGVASGCSSVGMVALTFDGGPSLKTTDGHLTTLRTLDVHGSFNMRASNICTDAMKAMTLRVRNEGHAIGMMAESDWPLVGDDMKKFSTSIKDLDAKVAKAELVFADVLGAHPRTVLLPHGAYGYPAVSYFVARGYMVIDSSAYGGNDSGDCLSTAKTLPEVNADSGSSYIMSINDHESGTQPDDTGSIVGALKDKHYIMVRQDECIGLVPTDGVYSTSMRLVTTERSPMPTRTMSYGSLTSGSDLSTSTQLSSSTSSMKTTSTTTTSSRQPTATQQGAPMVGSGAAAMWPSMNFITTLVVMPTLMGFVMMLM